GEERERRHHDRVARTDAEREQRKRKRVAARADGDRRRRSEPHAHLVLEPFGLRPENVVCARQHRVDAAAGIGFDFLKIADEVEKRDQGTRIPAARTRRDIASPAEPRRTTSARRSSGVSSLFTITRGAPARTATSGRPAAG